MIQNIIVVYFNICSEKSNRAALIFKKENDIGNLFPGTEYQFGVKAICGKIDSYLFNQIEKVLTMRITAERSVYKHEVPEIKKVMEKVGWSLVVDESEL